MTANRRLIFFLLAVLFSIAQATASLVGVQECHVSTNVRAWHETTSQTSIVYDSTQKSIETYDESSTLDAGDKEITAVGKGTHFADFAKSVAAKGISAGDSVIAETLAGKGNITSKFTLSADEALSAGEDFVGSGYSEIGKPGSGVFRSSDGLRQFRMDANSLNGAHAPNVPHIHFETYAPGAKFPTVNNHVPFFE